MRDLGRASLLVDIGLCRPAAGRGVEASVDVDLERARVRFREKGGRAIRKPLPVEFATLLRAAYLCGEVDCSADDYVIPMQREQKHGRERDDRVIYRYVKRLGARAGARFTPTRFAAHSLSSSWRRIRAS
jgi:glutathione S-transferase